MCVSRLSYGLTRARLPFQYRPDDVGAKVPSDRAAVAGRIAATDGAIDRLVYDLYGLTADEVRLVEGAAGGPPGDGG